VLNELVSIIIPSYNQGHFLAEAIESVLSQSYPHVEIIMVDDGSTDDSFLVASGYQGVRCIKQENQGISGARNRGAQESSGAYLIFLDADDLLLPNSLELGLRHFKDRPEVALVAGHCQHISPDRSPLPTPPQRLVEEDHYIELLRDNYIWPPASVIFRRSQFESVGGFNRSLSGSADHDIYLRIAAKFPIHFHNDVVALYRQHETNMSSNCFLMLRESVLTLKSQKHHLKGTKEFEAYMSGLKECRCLYRETAHAKIRNTMKARAWRQAISEGWTLLRYDPPGFAKFALPGFYCAFFEMKDHLRNTAMTFKHLIRGRSFGFIKANPRVIRLSNGRETGETSLSWKSVRTKEIEVRVDSPDGTLLSHAGSSGCAKTGAWVRDGTMFYLQDVSAAAPRAASNTIAVITVNVITNK
jgi:glycosyltransferase involved in cell wall biosynthesis